MPYFCLILFIGATTCSLHTSTAMPQWSFLPWKFLSPVPEPMRFKFFPDDGTKYREEFESKYGVHGEHLIHMLGKGLMNESNKFNHSDSIQENGRHLSSTAVPSKQTENQTERDNKNYKKQSG